MEEPSGSPLDLGPIDRAGPAYGSPSPSPSPAVGARPLGLSAKSVRHVSGKVKAAVYREYGIAHHASGEYEVDYLISLELGGSHSHRHRGRTFSGRTFPRIRGGSTGLNPIGEPPRRLRRQLSVTMPSIQCDDDIADQFAALDRLMSVGDAIEREAGGDAVLETRIGQ